VKFKPKPFGDFDVDVKIVACGVCGSDVHTATGGWGNKHWPLIPGHGMDVLDMTSFSYS
jgi:alcohol dehydrogenase (NADP+)